MQLNKFLKWCPLFLGLLILIILIFINFDNKNFFKMNFYEILTIVFLFFVSYYFVEKKSDKRIMNAKIEETLSILKEELNKIDDSLFCENFKIRDYTIIHRKISNKITLLEHYMKNIGIRVEVEYIKNAIFEMDEMISNHLNELDVLRTILVDVDNKKNQIDVRMDNIFKKLY